MMLLTPRTAANPNQPLLKWFIFFPYNLIISAQVRGCSNELSHAAERSGKKMGRQRIGVELQGAWGWWPGTAVPLQVPRLPPWGPFLL